MLTDEEFIAQHGVALYSLLKGARLLEARDCLQLLIMIQDGKIALDAAIELLKEFLNTQEIEYVSLCGDIEILK